jgi:hypothetical protein
MPQILFRYNEFLFSENPNVLLKKLGQQIIPLVLEATTTAESPLVFKDIDWITQPHGPGTTAAPIAIELRTFGFPARKAKLTEDALKALKEKILALPLLNRGAINKDDPLIWLQ